MRRRLFCPLLAAAVLATALGGVATPASAAIRIIIGDGVNAANDKVYYSAGGSLENSFATFATDFDGYELVATTTTSNYSGTQAEGFLAQSVTVNDFGGTTPLSQLRVSTAIIANQGSLTTGQQTGGNAMSVANAPMLMFTLPSDSLLRVTSRVNTLGAVDTGAVVQLATIVNGGTTTSTTTVDGSFNQMVGSAIGQPGYTLASEITLSGASPGAQGLQLIGRSSVTAPALEAPLVPEPATMLVWGLGSLGLVFAARRRRGNSTAA